ncbi:hypothetical protein [Nocardioides plantarum]|uniref:SnoaL-like domain-containing protein n=1 Tax=Nocardioides plantarum TaxID=29299 RepID=A0ABV5KF02_9ACTN|nr:hypothetical protein [Nocardioides plantarum]
MPDEVVSLFADLVNDGSSDARRLTTDASLVDVDGTLDVQANDVTAADPSEGRERAVVSSLYRVLPPTARQPFIDYCEATIQKSRRPGAVWQMDAIILGEVVPTGR